jgi:hypothetical protein
MEWLGPLALTVAIVAVLVALMGLGWRNRLRRQSGVSAPPAVPADPGRVLYTTEGQYVATTTAGDWLDRIAVHGLGVRSEAIASVHPDGVLLARRGAPDVYIPRSDLTGVRLESGMTGKFVEKDGLVVLSWRLNGDGVDTGFRTRHATDKTQLLAAVAALTPGAHLPDDPGNDSLDNSTKNSTNNSPNDPEGRNPQ